MTRSATTSPLGFQQRHPGCRDLDIQLAAATRGALSAIQDSGWAAFVAWRAATGASDEESDRALFASEAAFAAAARAAAECRDTSERIAAEQAMPHLFSSRLFSWYCPPNQARLRDALSNLNEVDPIELLSHLYESTVPDTTRKRFGQFYTPPQIVELMLDSIGFAGPGVLDKRLIDPAVGAGAFLIAAARRLIHEASQRDFSGGQLWNCVQGALFGLDVNPLGVLLTEAAIGLMLCGHLREDDRIGLRPLHLYVTDTLDLAHQGVEVERAAELENIKSRDGAYATGFDYVVANPPYAKYPSRLLTEAQRDRFAATTYGHPNLYGLFLQVGVELLSNEGRMAFITPKSFVSGLYFENLRRYLTERLDFIRFDTFHERKGLFNGVLQDVVILSARRRTTAKQRDTIEIREFSNSVNSSSKSIQVPSSAVLLGKRFANAFYIDADELAHRLLARMSEETVALSSLGIRVATGTVVWNRLKGHMRDIEGKDVLPLIWGNGVRQYCFTGLGNRARRSAFAVLDSKTAGIVTRGDALLVKRMTAKEESRRLVACRVPDQLARSRAGYFAENHLNLIIAEENAAIELDAVMGLLNSSLFDYVFRSLNGNTQVSATELRMLPIRRGPQLQAIAAQARRLTETAGADPNAGARIDVLVAELYGLEEQERTVLADAYAAAS
ncbi:MAG: N-6 DNA methylase [Actinobacteria bacterium]|nr:N-6 DNA methylase [Actinomycetota bacterium]